MGIDAKTFQNRLWGGFGRVILFLRKTDAAPFREAILDSCLHHRAFDRQAEEYRTDYLLDVMQATGEPEFYAAYVRRALDAGSGEDDGGQLYALARRLAERGDAEARRAMYRRFARQAAFQNTGGAEEIVALDGLDGYLFVAAQWQRHPLPEEDHWQEAWLREQLDMQIGPDDTRRALADAAHAQPELAVYFASVEQKQAQRKAQQSKPRPPAPTYEEITARIADPTQTTRWPAWRSWSRRLDDDTLARLALDLLTETDRGPLLKRLHVFRQRLSRLRLILCFNLRGARRGPCRGGPAGAGQSHRSAHPCAGAEPRGRRRTSAGCAASAEEQLRFRRLCADCPSS